MAFLPQKIKRIRTRENLSQEVFGVLLGYSKGYIANIETGRTKPSRRFLETIQKKCNVSIDWLLNENRIFDLIENTKSTWPLILFVYAFTQGAIDQNEQILRDYDTNMRRIIINASDIKTENQLLNKICGRKGSTVNLFAVLQNLLLSEEILLVIKNLSLSKILYSGNIIRKIFGTILDDWKIRADMMNRGEKFSLISTKSVLILLDYPSYLEKNIGSFGPYVHPEYSKPYSMP